MTEGRPDVPPILEALVNAQVWLSTLRAEGVDLMTNAHLKVPVEAHEFTADPTPEEAADVVIAVLASLLGNGYTINDLARAVTAKVAVNETRQWALLPDGTYQHVPQEEPTYELPDWLCEHGVRVHREAARTRRPLIGPGSPDGGK